MTFLVAALILFAAPGQADSTAPCRAYSDATIVFVGTVTSETSVDRPDPGPSGMRSRAMPRPIRICTVRVDETLLGSPGPVVRIVDAEQRGERNLAVGERYLVYASEGRYGDVPADADRIRAVPLAEASGDIAYVRGLAPGDGAFVSGRVDRLDYDSSREKLIDHPVPGVEVVLERDARTYSARTGADGAFVLPNVPAGRYRVRTNPRADDSGLVDNEITIPERGCATLAFRNYPHGVVEGRLVDTAGAPVKGVDVMIVPAGRTAVSGNYWVRTTDDAGAFRFEAVPEGAYTLGADIVARAYGPGEFGPAFYPGVGDRAKATVIRVGKEGVVDAGPLTLPDAPPTRGVTGSVTLKTKGNIPDRTQVHVRNARAIDGQAREIDVKDDGTFSFEALLGESYVLEARGGGLGSKPVRLAVDGHVDGVRIELTPKERPRTPD